MLKHLFCNFRAMDDQEQIKRLQEELVLLHNQVKTQQQKIQELYHQTIALSGKPVGGKAFRQLRAFSLENFIGFRLIHLIGIVVLVIGLSIGVKYAIDKNLISEVMRIALAYAAGGVLYFLSYRLKKKYSLFSSILFKRCNGVGLFYYLRGFCLLQHDAGDCGLYHYDCPDSLYGLPGYCL